MQQFNRIFPAVIGWGLLVAVAILTVILLRWKWALIVVTSILVVILLFYRVPWMGFGPHPLKTTETKEYDASGTNLTKKTVTQETQAHRTLWDWIGLVTLSAVLAVVAFVYTREQQAQQEYIQDQKAKDASLQAYIDGMAILLLDENLPMSEEDAVVRDVARARTLVALLAVGPERKRNVVRFLYESNLINTPNRIVDLSEANLEDADLTNSPLSGIDLRGTNLSDGPDPDSQGALLMGADLQDARVDSADLSHANLKAQRESPTRNCSNKLNCSRTPSCPTDRSTPNGEGPAENLTHTEFPGPCKMISAKLPRATYRRTTSQKAPFETVRKGARATLRAWIWPVYGAL